jgi:DNA-binding Lrp family transcriptional regulator
MRRAFVMVNADLGSEDELQSELKKVEGVVGVYQVYGVYDMIVQVEAESDQKLKEILFSRIRSLRHVRSTLTLTTTS